MATPRLHIVLEELFQTKHLELVTLLQNHLDFDSFQKALNLSIPAEEFSKAFTHTSFKHEFKVSDQEILEFLGDAVLDLILTQELVQRFPSEKEGTLSKLRSSLVNEKLLASLARNLNLQNLVLIGKGEYFKKTHHQDVVLADTLEALLGVIYLNQGLNVARDFFIRELLALYPDALDLNFVGNFDHKSKLQELTLKKYKQLPRYVAKEMDNKFFIELWINEKLLESGLFQSKKDGEKALAELALKNGTL
jgi:ribonuclease III